MIRLSIIIPCYNEQDRLFKTYLRLRAFFEAQRFKVEYVLVNDGSTDHTILTMQLLAKKDPKVTVISYPQNMGKGYAVRQGLLNSHYFTKVILDADLSITPEPLLNIDWRGDWHVIKGKRAFINEPITRRILGWGWHQLIFLYVGLDCDTQSPFTVLRLPRTLYRHLYTDGFAYDVELLYKARRRHCLIVSLPVPYEYHPGSKVTVGKTLKMLREIRKIKNKRK